MAGIELTTDIHAPLASPADGPLPVQVAILIETIPENSGNATLFVSSLNTKTTDMTPLKPDAIGYVPIEIDDNLIDFDPALEQNGVVWIDIPPGTPENLTRARVGFDIKMLLDGQPVIISRNIFSMVSDGSKIWFARGSTDGVARIRANLFCRPIAEEPVRDGPWKGHPDADRGLEEGVPVVEPCTPEDDG